jgi:PIN domain nuclease of toxin-antitoxin system
VRLIVDTHVLLWAAAEPARLPAGVRARLEAPDHTVLFSAASIWEIAIKVQIGRLPPEAAPDAVAAAAVRMGFAEIPVNSGHAAAVTRLPLHHRDPFDRLLIAQALLEPATLLTADRALTQYSELVELID